jgi:O-antigen ligase
MNRSLVLQPNRLSTMSWKVPLAFLLLLALFLVIALSNGIAPMLWVAAPFAVAGFFAAAWYVPEFFMVAAVFMPQWKVGWPFSLFDSSGYLTLVMLVGLALGIAFVCFRISLGLDKWTFEGVFFRQRHVLLLFGFFVAVVALSYFYTDAPTYGASKLGRLVFIGGLLLLAPLFLLRTERLFKRFARLFVIFALITALQMIIGLKVRAAGVDTDITRIGDGWLVAMALLLLLFYPVLNNTNRHKLYLALALPLLAAGMVASVARGALVAFALVLPLAIFFGPKQRQRGMTLVVLVLGACSVGAYFFLRTANPDKYGHKISELVEMSEGHTGSGSAGKRIAFYTETAQAIPQHPVLGNGVGSWSVFYFGNDARAYPHNLALEIAFEEGLLGLAAFVVFFLAVGVASYNTYVVSGRYFTIFGVIVLYSLMVSMFSGDLDDNRLLWLWAGVALAACRNAYLARLQPARYAQMNNLAAAARTPRYDRMPRYQASNARTSNPRPSRLSTPALSTNPKPGLSQST